MVDDADYPTRVIGVADGLGGLVAHTGQYRENVQKVVEAINTQKVQAKV